MMFPGRRISCANSRRTEEIDGSNRNVSKPFASNSMGRRIQMCKMLFIASIPIGMLLVLVGSLFGHRLGAFRLQTVARNRMALGVGMSSVVHGLQNERDSSALFISALGLATKRVLLASYEYTDRVILDIVDDLIRERHSAPEGYLRSSESFISHLNMHRYQLEANRSTEKSEMLYYSQIMNTVTRWYMASTREASSGNVWKLLMSLNEVMDSNEQFGLERAYGTSYFLRGGFRDVAQQIQFSKAQHTAKGSLQASRRYSKITEDAYEKAFANVTDKMVADIEAMRTTILNNSFSGELNNFTVARAYSWYGNATIYIDALHVLQKDVIWNIKERIIHNVFNDRIYLITLGTVAVISLLVSPWVLHSVAMLTLQMQSYSLTLDESTKELKQEMRRSSELLVAMLPKSIALQLKNNEKVSPEVFDEVTIFISDIIGFTRICSRSSPMQVINFLDHLYTSFDEISEMYDVYKVETIGDAYMVASGLPIRNGNRHAAEICTMALYLLRLTCAWIIPHMPGTKLKLRIGCHTGPIIAGVVGKRMPRYSLFGKTLDIAAKMESTGSAYRVHISESTKNALDHYPEFITELRRSRVLENGRHPTYWLIGKDNLSPVDVPLYDSESSSSTGVIGY